MKNYLSNILCFAIMMITTTHLNAEKITYKLSMPEPHTHYFEVEMRIEQTTENELLLKMATWTPGSYLIREYSKNVEGFAAFSDKGQPLSFEKLNKNTWKVSCEKKATVVVKYKVYAFELSVRHSFLDDTHAYINGTTLFMFIDKKLNLPSTLEIEPFSTFKRISTGLDPVEASNPWILKADDYDMLVDCPIEIGNHEVFEFTASGVLHQIAMYGPGNYNKEELIKDLTKIVEVSTEVFGQNPNKRYVFIIHNLTQGGGGLEHTNSTSIQVNRWSYQPYNSYLGFLSLAAHEYFHLWNVKRIRPKTLAFYDYENENYTDLLWVMEGFTSYYDELLLLRAGFYTQQRYLDKLSGGITSIENQPGNGVQALSSSSFDAWIRAYRTNENSYNSEISYYSKGALVACLIDQEIIKASRGEKNLDDLMRALYQRYYLESKEGFDQAALIKTLKDLTGKDFTEFIQNHINGTAAFDYNSHFAASGFEMQITDDPDDTELGAFTKQQGDGLMITTVKRGTSAYEAGLNVNDEIIAVDGFRVDKSDLEKVLAGKKPGDELVFTISRDKQMRDIRVTMLPGTQKKYTLVPLANPSKIQISGKKRWLN